MRLRPGQNPTDVAKRLRDVALPGNPLGGSIINQGGDNLINAFVAWFNDVERTLCHYFSDPDLNALHTARYWQLSEHGMRLPRYNESARAEAEWQFNRLLSVAEELESEVARWRRNPDARIAVVDTNVFLHCVPLQDFGDWSFVAKAPIRVVVPIRVVEELDSKKRDRNADLADRARRSIRWLTEKMVPTNGGPARIRATVTVETFTPIGCREIVPTADTEILEACDSLETFAGVGVSVVTSDLGMQLRAVNAGITVCPVPDEYRLDLP